MDYDSDTTPSSIECLFAAVGDIIMEALSIDVDDADIVAEIDREGFLLPGKEPAKPRHFVTSFEALAKGDKPPDLSRIERHLEDLDADSMKLSDQSSLSTVSVSLASGVNAGNDLPRNEGHMDSSDVDEVLDEEVRDLDSSIERPYGDAFSS